MKWHDCPKWIQNLVLIRHKESGCIRFTNIQEFEDNDGFTFSSTPEGQKFWAEIRFNDKTPDPSTYVKVGDWVQITKSDIHWDKGMDKYVGKTVQVIPHPKPGCIFAVSFNENCSGFYWQLESGHFVKANPPSQSISPTPEDLIPEVFRELEVGDKVRVTEAGFAVRDHKFRKIREGKIGILIEDDSTSLPYRVEWENEDTNWFREGEIELASKHSTTQFAETTIQLIQQSSFKSTNNEINFSRKTATISSGEECQETRLCSKPKFTPTPSRY